MREGGAQKFTKKGGEVGEGILKRKEVGRQDTWSQRK